MQLRVCFFLLSFVALARSQTTQWPECKGPSGFSDLTHLPDNLTCAAPSCPDCDLVTCLPKLDPLDCPSDYFYRENTIYGGCCPACVRYLETYTHYYIEQEIDRDEFCQGPFESSDPTGPQSLIQEGVYALPCVKDDDGNDILVHSESWLPEGDDKVVPLVTLYSCLPELMCDDVESACMIQRFDCDTVPYYYCDVVEEQYECKAQAGYYKDWVENGNCGVILWDVQCDSRGRYDKVQRKENQQISLEKRDMCFDPSGHSLFGYTTEEEERLSCECSRKRWELDNALTASSGTVDTDVPLYMRARTDVSLHCSDTGDYETLQCDMGRCWCADPTTGRPTSTVLLQEFFDLLPCYQDETVSGDQYLRRCESRSVARSQIRQLLSYHGQNWPEHPYEDIECDYDGSFGKFRCIESQETCFCADKYGQQITQYMSDLSYEPYMDCGCARDSEEDLTTLSCNVFTGGYDEVQTVNGAVVCVDEDGFPYTGYYQNQNCEIPTCDSAAMTAHCNDAFTGLNSCSSGDGCQLEDGSCDLNFLS